MNPLLPGIIRGYFKSYSGLPRACWERVAINFLNATSAGLYFFLSFYFVRVLHIDIAIAGAIISIYGCGRALGGFIGGKLSDRFSPEMVSIVSLFIEGLAFLTLTTLHSPMGIAVNVFIQGVATYSFKTGNHFCALNYCGQEESVRLKMINVLYSASNLGLGLSALFISFLSDMGFRYLFLLASCLLFCSAIYLMIAYPKWERENDEWEASAELSHDIETLKNERHHHAVIILVLGCVLLTGLIFSQLGVTYSIYVRELFPNLGIRGFGILFVVNTALIVFLQTPIVNYFKRYNKIIMIGFGALFVGLSMVALTFSKFFVLALLSGIIFTFGEMLCVPLAQLACFQYSPDERKGRNLGLFQTVFALSMIVGPGLGGFVYHHDGSLLWYLSGLIGLICFFSCFLFHRFVSVSPID